MQRRGKVSLAELKKRNRKYADDFAQEHDVLTADEEEAMTRLGKFLAVIYPLVGVLEDEVRWVVVGEGVHGSEGSRAPNWSYERRTPWSLRPSRRTTSIFPV